MGTNSVPKFIFRLSRFPVYRGSVLGRVYCTMLVLVMIANPRNFTNFLLHSCTVAEVMYTLHPVIFRGRHAV